MALAFQRFFIPAVRIVIPTLTPVPLVIENLDGQGIRVMWSIERDNTNKPDQGTITIYNLSPTLSGAIFQTWQVLQTRSGSGVQGMELDLSIGYDKLPSRVFLGSVWDMVAADRQEANEVRTIFQLGDGNDSIRDQTLGRDYHKVEIAILVRFLVEGLTNDGGGLGLIFPPESAALIETAQREVPNPAFANIPNGYNTREVLDVALATLGLTWRVHNREFIVLRGGFIDRPGPVLRPGNGLIDYTPRNDGGIDAVSLARADMQPGSQFFVQDDNGKAFAEPFYRATRVGFEGDTRGNSTMSVTGAKGLPV